MHVTCRLCRMDQSTDGLTIEVAFQPELPHIIALTGLL